MREYVLLLLLLLGICGLPEASAQIADSIKRANATPPPVVELELPEADTPREFSPRQALMWSLIPGGGQVYNRRWWKVPLVFSAFSGVYAVLDFNQSTYTRFRTAYQLELAGDTHEFTGRYDANSLRVFRDNFNKQRQTNYFMLGAVYLLQGVEAYVDAHLRSFDIDEDLSQWQVRPQVRPGLGWQPATVVLEVRYAF